MSSIGPFAPTGVGRPSLLNALAESRGKLDDLVVQLSSGKKSQTYAGLGAGASTSLAMKARLSAISSYQDTSATVKTRIELMAQSLTRLDDIGAEYRLTDANQYQLTTGSTTIAQNQAAVDLKEAIAALNLQVGGRYLFSGRATDVKPVLTADAILADDGARAGLRSVIAERKLADLGADGRGRLDVSGVAGSSFTVSEEGAGPFGFKITSLSSTLENGVAAGPAGAPPSITLGVTGGAQAGGQIRVGLTLPDGTTDEIILTAKAASEGAALGEGEFRIGADAAATAANMREAFDGALRTRAATALVAASAMQAGEEFFDTPAGAEPARVAGFDGAYAAEAERTAALQSAAALDSTGTAQKTVSWYMGERAADDPRKTAGARIDDGVGVAYGARADEDGTRRVIRNLSVFSALTFSTDDPDGKARYAELASRVVTTFAASEASAELETMAVDLASASTAIAAAGARHKAAKDMAATRISAVEDVSKEEVSLQILALQTQLQASYQVAATLKQLSLVNYL